MENYLCHVTWHAQSVSFLPKEYGPKAAATALQLVVPAPRNDQEIREVTALLPLSTQKLFITELLDVVAGYCFQPFWKSSSLLLLGQTLELAAKQGLLTRAEQEVKTLTSHHGLQAVWGVITDSELSVLT